MDSLEPSPATSAKHDSLADLARRWEAASAASRFVPAWWLPGGHAHSAWGPLARREGGAGLVPERWATPDDDFLRVHIREGRPDRPTLMIVHGLEGSARSPYVAGLTRLFAAAGWTCAVFEHRTCGGVMNRARRTYHSGETEDLAFVARRLLERRPGAALYIVGVSLGGNQLLRWMGERGDALPARVAAAAAISPPFDLTASGPQIDRALGGYYVRRFLRSLIPKMIEKERQYPGCIDIEAVRRSRTFEQFDTHATAALHGFRDAWDYWERVSCGPLLERIRRPTLLIAAQDDPFNPASSLPRRAAARSPWLFPLFTSAGGHVGFVEGAVPWAPRYWAERQVFRFFRTVWERAEDRTGR